jgi:hypothetical protein
MVYDFFVKLMGAGIAVLIAFLPLQFEYLNDTLVVQTELSSLVTEEITELVKQDFPFSVEFYCSIIINDQRTHRQSFIRELTWGREYLVDGIEVSVKTLQESMGRVKFVFPELHLAEGDEILIFVKATIQPDKIFEQSTGMSTRILWNHYVPRLKTTYIFTKGKFIEK